MQSYLSGRGANIQPDDSEENTNSFGSYLSGTNKQQSAPQTTEPVPEGTDLVTETIHTDETGIKVEVLSSDGVPSNILIHIPDGRVIDLNCEY